MNIPTQDMVLGSYYLTYEREPEPVAERSYKSAADVNKVVKAGEITPEDQVWVKDDGQYTGYRRTLAGLCEGVKGSDLPACYYRSYANDDEARLAYDEGTLDLHEPILVRRAWSDGEATEHKMCAPPWAFDL